MHGLRLGDNAVRQLENLRYRKIHTHVRTSKIWCNSTSTHAIKENIEKKGRVNDTKAGRVWKKINFGEKKEKKKTSALSFLGVGVDGGDCEVYGKCEKSSGSSESE